MKHLLVLCALVVATSASGGYGVPLGGRLGPLQSSFGHGLAPYGLQGASLDYYSVPDYSYGYGVSDPASGVHNTKQENRLGDRTEGSYSVDLPDGRRQVVTYWVDGDSGYNARVTYEGVAQHPQTTGYGASFHGVGGLGYGGVNALGRGHVNGIGYGGVSSLGLGGVNGIGYGGVSSLGLGGVNGSGYGGVIGVRSRAVGGLRYGGH